MAKNMNDFTMSAQVLKSLNDFLVLAQGPKGGVHRFLISCTVEHHDGTITELSGDDAIVFPDILGEMSVKQRREFVVGIAQGLINFKLNQKSNSNLN
jgi:hypothetical protein